MVKKLKDGYKEKIVVDYLTPDDELVVNCLAQ